MKVFADARWRDLLLVFVATVALMVAMQAIRGEALLSDTARISVPAAGVLVVLLLAYAKRRERRRAQH